MHSLEASAFTGRTFLRSEVYSRRSRLPYFGCLSWYIWGHLSDMLRTKWSLSPAFLHRT